MKWQFLFLFLFLIWIIPQNHATTLRVSSSDELLRAIESCEPGDSVLLAEGVYSIENIVVDRPVFLLGSQRVILDGGRKSEIISIKSNNVFIEGITLRNSGRDAMVEPAAIKVYESRNVEISGCLFEWNYIGVYLQYCQNVCIRNNRIKGYSGKEQFIGNGIHAWKCDSIQIIANDITGHRDGIYLDFVENSIVWRNLSYNNIRYGLHFMFSHHDAYIGNVFTNNGAGVAVMFTKYVQMINNKFADNVGDISYGLLLKEISDSRIYSNSFRSNSAAIYADGVTRTQISGNDFLNNGWGLKLKASSVENVFELNNFMGNTFDISTNGTIVNNTFCRNYWDKYKGYDLDRNGIGDVPFRPLSLFGVISAQNESSLFFFRSFIVALLEESERLVPLITPESFEDKTPALIPWRHA